jgi:hypothetical protein
MSRPPNLPGFLAERLTDTETTWSVGTFGAIAEFMRDVDEPAKILCGDHAITAVTAKGGLRIDAHPKLRPFASESLTTQSWGQRVALCLPAEAAPMNGLGELTELGPDRDALRVEDRTGVLFDLGLGTLQVDACIRSGDAAVIAALRRYICKSVFATDSVALGVILQSNPHRVFVSRLGRVEVFQPIPPANGKSPEGPHTHVLPKLLAHHRTHSATEPVPDGWVPCAHLYPPHPLRDGFGPNRPFQGNCHIAFQNLLLRYGDPERVALKRRIIYSVMAGHGPAEIVIPGDRFSRAAVRITLRQLQASGPSSAALSSWLSHHDRTESQKTEDPMEALH